MKISVFLFLLFVWNGSAIGQEQNMSYKSDFQTADTTFRIRLKTGERHGLWKLKCYQNLNERKNTLYLTDDLAVGLQDFFSSTISPFVESRILSRLHISEVEFFNERPVTTVDSLTWNGLHNPKCDEVRYNFKCFFMFDDSTWFPLRLYVNQAGELMHQSSILSTLSKLESFKLSSREEIFAQAYDHRHFSEYGVNKDFNLYYSEKKKLFYYEFISNRGEEIERTSNSVTVKMRHMFIDAFTGKVLWKPEIIHENGGGSCSIWTNMKIPKNRLI